jgi:putative membrane protein
MENLIRVLVFSLSSFAFLFIVTKVLGKKQLAELSFIDYVVGISIGSIAADWSTETEQPFYHFLIAISIYCLFSLLLDWLERKQPFRKFLKGEVLTIIEEGEFNYENLKKSKLDVEDVLGMAREKDIFDVEDIAYALFETTGKLSILPKSPKRPTVIEDFDIQEEPASLTDYVIVNGKLRYEVVRELGMNVETLFDRLKIRSKKDLENFLVVSYDKEKKDFLVHRR